MSEPILFRKISAVFGQAPVGEEVYVFLPMRLGQRDWSETERRHRAWRIFKRDRPDENPMEWEIAATASATTQPPASTRDSAPRAPGVESDSSRRRRD